jgi:hypothetical protein
VPVNAAFAARPLGRGLAQRRVAAHAHRELARRQPKGADDGLVQDGEVLSVHVKVVPHGADW